MLILLIGVILPSIPNGWLLYPLVGITLLLFIINILKLICLSSSKIFVYFIAKAIKISLENQSIISHGATLKVSKQKKGIINVVLISENLKEQKVFHNAVCEFFSPMDNPRYILIKTILNLKIYRYSYQIPKLFSTNKSMAHDFYARLKAILSGTVIYNSTKNQKVIYKAQKRNYISKKNKPVSQKQVVV